MEVDQEPPRPMLDPLPQPVDAQMPTTVMADYLAPRQKAIFNTPLSCQRYKWCQDYIDQFKHIKTITDFGCGNGKMFLWLKHIKHVTNINFVDSDIDLIESQLYNHFQPTLLEALFGRQLTDVGLDIKVYAADLLTPYEELAADCVTMVEVIEHMTPRDVDTAVRTVFGYYQPEIVLITTPNKEFNHLLKEPDEDPNSFRHYDHKFEWTRAEFQQWAHTVCSHFPYSVCFHGVGHLPNSEPYGPCTQIAAFHRQGPKVSSIDCFDLLLNKLNVHEYTTDWGTVISTEKDLRLKGHFNLPPMRVDVTTREPEAPFDWSTVT